MAEQVIPVTTIDEIKKQAIGLETLHGEQTKLYKRYREMYFMDNIERPKLGKVDEGDVKLTPSPSSRNEVIGMQRLLNTASVQVKVKTGDETADNSDKIERALKKMLAVSATGKRASVESDAALSAVLYGPVIVYAESIADLLAVTDIKPWRKAHLAKLLMKSPFLIRTLNAEESFIEREDGQIILHNWKSTVKGSKVQTKWGVECSRDKDYIIRDVYTPEYHIVWAEGIDKVLFAGAHGLGCVPVFCTLAGGSELFHKPEEQINSFLYAKAKGNLDIRENSLLTVYFTNLHIRGLAGPLISLDPEGLPDNVKVDYSNSGLRTITAKANVLDDKVIDPSLMTIRNMLQEMSGESTVYKQTLGQNINNSTFSGLAMLSSSGKLPMVDSKRALESAFKDCFEHILYRIKTENIANPLIEASEIPDQYELEVSFDPKLPQDDLRNAQVAQQLKGIVSTEYIQQEVLQVPDAASMRKQVTKEIVLDGLRATMAQNPEIMGGMLARVIPQLLPQKPPATDPNMPPTDPNAPPPEGVAGNMNMEAVPQQDAMVPPGERMM